MTALGGNIAGGVGVSVQNDVLALEGAVYDGVELTLHVDGHVLQFESGVNYAVKNLGATAEMVELASYAGTDVTGTLVGGNYTGNFGDLEAGKALGNALIKEGCDIIFVAAGDSGTPDSKPN